VYVCMHWWLCCYRLSYYFSSGFAFCIS